MFQGQGRAGGPSCRVDVWLKVTGKGSRWQGVVRGQWSGLEGICVAVVGAMLWS